jgi:hypothetical protein
MTGAREPNGISDRAVRNTASQSRLHLGETGGVERTSSCDGLEGAGAFGVTDTHRGMLIGEALHSRAKRDLSRASLASPA